MDLFSSLFAAAVLASVVLTVLVLFGAPARSPHPAAPAATVAAEVQ